MATVYYPAFDVVTIASNGVVSPYASGSLNLYNVTTSTSLGTKSTDANGVLSEGSVTATAGDIIRFSHATYAGTILFTLTANQADAYTNPNNLKIRFVVRDQRTGASTSDSAHLFITDTAQPNLPPIPAAVGDAGTTVLIPYTSPITQNLKILGIAQDGRKQLKTIEFEKAQSATVTVPGSAATLGYTAEDVANKSTNVTTDGASDIKYPSVKAVKTYADALVVGLWDDRGNFNASVNTFPTSGGSGSAGAILKGDIWTISVVATSGPLLGYPVGSTVRALVDSPGSTAGNWDVLNVGIGYVPENQVNKDTDVTLAANSDTKYPSQKAVKAFAAPETNATIGAIVHGATAETSLPDSAEFYVYDSTGKKIPFDVLRQELRKTFDFQPNFQRMLILGNSITIYPNDDLGTDWWHITDRGMAASKQSRDFVHVLRDLMSTYSPNMTFLAHYCLDWETAHHTFTYSTYDSLFSTVPDIILIRLGENVSTGDLSTYQADFQALINYCKGKAPAAKIFVTGNFWSGSAVSKDSYQQAAAKASNVRFISLEYLNEPGTQPVSGDIVYDMGGTARALTAGAILAHPNDVGMNNIAVACYEGIYKVQDFQPGYFIDAGRTSGGVVAAYDDDSRYAFSGSTSSTALTIDVSLIAQPPPTAIWNTQRYGGQQYRFDRLVPNASYTIELFTAENSGSPGSGKRTFTVSVNANTLRTMTGPSGFSGTTYDAYVRAGSVANKGTAAVLTENATPGGWLTVEVLSTGSTDPCQIMAVRIIKV